jgi:hypothetical protein
MQSFDRIRKVLQLITCLKKLNREVRFFFWPSSMREFNSCFSPHADYVEEIISRYLCILGNHIDVLHIDDISVIRYRDWK